MIITIYQHVKNLGMLALCSLLIVTATACRSRADAPAPVAGNVPRALWVWDAGVATNTADRATFLEFCRNQHISTVFLSLGDFDDAKKLSPENRKHLTPEMLGDFVERAHAEGVKVQGLGGDPRFALTGQHEAALQEMQSVLDYNRQVGPKRRLDGYQWDVEPYTLKEFKTDQHDSILAQYLGFVNAAVMMVKSDSPDRPFALGFAVPFWFDKDEHSTKWQDKTQPVVFDVLDVLSAVPDSYIAIMAYRDHATGSSGSIDVSQTEIDYVDAHTPKVGVWVGMETGDVQPASITFHGKTNAELEQAIGEVDAAFKADASFRGVAIHHWGSYRELVNR